MSKGFPRRGLAAGGAASEALPASVRARGPAAARGRPNPPIRLLPCAPVGSTDPVARHRMGAGGHGLRRAPGPREAGRLGSRETRGGLG